jgi:hypothetical protein
MHFIFIAIQNPATAADSMKKAQTFVTMRTTEKHFWGCRKTISSPPPNSAAVSPPPDENIPKFFG